jgi:hypothetical protein
LPFVREDGGGEPGQIRWQFVCVDNRALTTCLTVTPSADNWRPGFAAGVKIWRLAQVVLQGSGSSGGDRGLVALLVFKAIDLPDGD